MKRVFIILFFAGFALGDALKFSDGSLIDGSYIKLKSDSIFIDGISFPREQVREIIFNNPETTDMEFEKRCPFFDKKELMADARKNEKKYPDASGIILRDVGTYTLLPGGRQIYRYHFAGKILKNAKLEWNKKILYFEAGRSMARVICERTIAPDGKEFFWDPLSFSIGEPTESGVFFDYGKVYTAIFPSVTVGSIVEYILEVEEFMPFDSNFFSPGFYFADDVPVIQSRCDVILPINKKLNYKNYFLPKDITKITTTDSTRTYSWFVRDAEPFLEEPHSPSSSDLVPHFEASLFEDWNYIYDWASGLQLARMKSTPEISSLVSEICQDAVSLEDSINRLYIWVQREIHYISVKGSISSGETGHPAQFTLDMRFGDCTDKSILLATMLREIGVEAFPIILMTNDEREVSREIPDISGNHAITLAIVHGKKYFLDATSTTHTFPYFRLDNCGVTYYCAICRNWGTIDVPPPEQNAQHIDLKVSVNENGSIEGEYFSNYIGDWEANERGFWEYQTPDARQFIISDWFSSLFGDVEILNWDLPGIGDLFSSFHEHFKFKSSNFGSRVGNILIFPLPLLTQDFRFSEVYLEKRKYPIEYTAPYRISHKIIFDLFDGALIEHIPSNISLTCGHASYDAGFEISDKRIIFTDDFKLYSRIIPVEDYHEYRLFCKKIEAFASSKIILGLNN